MGCFLSTSFCREPFLDDYLHIKVRSLRRLRVKGDYFKCHSKGDLYVRITYKGVTQSTHIKKNSNGESIYNENLILEGVKPCRSGNHCMKIELIDYDCITGNDVLGTCNIKVPSVVNESIKEKDYKLKDEEGHFVGYIGLDEIHFVKEKLNFYNGACKRMCCICCCQIMGDFNDYE